MKNTLSLFVVLIALLSSCSIKTEEAKQQAIVSQLESPAQAESAEPFLFTYQDSIVYLSWIEKKEKESTFKLASLDGNKWTTPITIASGNSWFVNWADYPMMARNQNGFIAHFLDRSADGKFTYDVKFTTSETMNTTWANPKILHDDGKQAEHGFVSLVPYDDKFFVTWLDGRNTVMEGMENMDHDHHGEMSLRAAVLDANGNKLHEWELDRRTCDCCQTSAAITSAGPVVIYRDRSDEEIRDMSIVRLVNGEWTAPQSINNDNWKIAGCPVNGPRVSAIGNTLTTAWFTMASDTAKVNVMFSHDGGETFGNAIRVDEGSPIGRVDIVLLDEQTAIVSWMEGTEIKAVKVRSDGTKEQSVTIAASSESRSSGFPQMTKSGDKLIFAWTDSKEKSIKLASLSM
ncbi:MAG: exo-alpha-sialidase [Cytophagales bacterium]|nr:exo-alpha-sialidase [Cytophagales bacterium]